jgi:gliding motility-associated-like protein
MKKTLLIFFVFLSISCFAQFSKTHYIPPLSNSDSQEPQGQYLYISSPSLTAINFKIFNLGGPILDGTVSRDNPYVLKIGTGFDTQLLISKNNVSSVMNNKGYIIEAEDLVYVTVRLTSTPLNYQAGGLVSKGLAALGTQFRIGAFINTGVPQTNNNHYTFATILATENNTTIAFNDIKSGVSLINNASVGNLPNSITLNRGDSYAIAVEGPNNANRDGLIGASITSSKPIAVNCGSFAGTNGTNGGNLDLGFDQIVSAERTGTEYIFIKGNGIDATERPLIVANENNTDVFLNGSTVSLINLKAGDYIALDGTQFSSDGNLYVRTSKNVFAYQGIGGTSNQANQNMHFVPPLSCETPKIINNIPYINEVGNNTDFTGTVCIVTETDASLDFIINGISYSLATLPSNILVNGPLNVTGNMNFKTYTFKGLTGNISIFSTKQVYLSYFGSSGAATYGGFYSGFTFKPEVAFQPMDTRQSNCIPNIELKVNTLTAFDTFQWYFNNEQISAANSSNYFPVQPGYYYVSASISECGTTLTSDKIPVSECPSNLDNDLANDNIDVDYDNDGILNCTESYGNLAINSQNPATGVVSIGSYSNNFTETVVTSSPAAPTPFIGNTDGSFVTEVLEGKGYSVAYNVNFSQPININLSYVDTANLTDLLNSNSEFIINSDLNKTVTVLNPTNQLLIDTNYDGIYESGVTQFSSFEIRFRLNGTTPLSAGTGTFKFQSYQTKSLKITHKNLLDSVGNKATFKLTATCIPKDSDSDAIPDQLDLDSDNDGIPDLIEGHKNAKVLLNTDANRDGLDNAFEPGIAPFDTDTDGIPDYLDLDSDNDGIYDLAESGSTSPDSNNDGILDGNTFGTDGLLNSLETSNDNGVLNYTIADTDSDGNKNYADLDSDNDLCNDVIEAGFTDPNFDGLLGNRPITVNANGLVTSGTGYTTPNANYITAAPISITTQPNVAPTCELQNATITLTDNNGNSYQWQIFKGGSWTDIVDDTTYAGVTTNTLSITSVESGMNGTKYRVQLNKTGNTCGLLSSETILKVYALPIVNNVTIIQCDDDLNAKTYFNLTVKNEVISSNYADETFTYYTSLAGANAANPAELIPTPLAFENVNPPMPAPQGLMSVGARVANKITGCYSVAKLTLKVVATNIPVSYNIALPPVCDDFLDIDGNNNANNNKRDGIATFDLSTTKATIEAKLPALTSTDFYNINYYRNQADALSETNVITDIANYRNIGYPNIQNIWVRVDSNIDNACYGLGPFVTLSVEALPFANVISIPRQCDDKQAGIFTFNTSNLETTLLGTNQTFPVTVAYFDAANSPLKDANGVLITSPFPSTFTTTSQTIKALVTNNTAQKCFDQTLITFIVDHKPEAFAIPVIHLTECDDEKDPTDQNGLIDFNTSTIESEILQGQRGMLVTYSLQNGTVLSTLAPTFTTGTQNVLVTVTNPLNPSCPATTTLNFIVNPLPKINLNTNGSENQLVCSNLPTFFVKLDAGIQDGSPTSNYTYIWSKDGTVLSGSGKTAYTLDVNAEGIYTVEVKNSSGCIRTRMIKVTASDIAHLDTIKIIDLVDINSIAVNITGQGQYEYSLDEPYGPFQVSPLFENVPAGIHEVYINDKNGCGIISQTVAVLGLPKYFTPNGDGYNDFWSVKGVNANFNTNSIIFIYDRYGQLITKINTNGEGWDGTFNGNSLPADDYWYTAKLEDGREAKGHFSLKR